MVWIKSRSNTYAHVLADSVRGTDEILHPHSSDAALDGVADSSGGVSIFGSNGFTAAGNDVAWVAESPSTYVAWCWKESATAGFDIVAYTGNATAGNTVSHSLSAVPKIIITKGRASTNNWSVYHESNGNGKALLMNLDYATQDYPSFWNDTTPSSSVFTLGDGSDTNPSGTMIAYLFAPKQGYSAMGSYTGNGNADGPFVYTGFRPALVIQKQATDTGTPWLMWDNKRNPYNETGQLLYPNTTGAEVDGGNPIDMLSNGFKLRTSGSYNNGSGKTITYMAFAEAPFVNSNGVPCNAR